MDNKKLNIAAHGLCPRQDKTSERMRHKFKQGVSWLLSQPLSDRLTDEEKEKIRNIYSDYIQILHLPSGKAVCEVLTTIFNKEFFKTEIEKL